MKIHYTHCPVCNHTNLEPLLTAQDHTVSKEYFPIVQCATCNFRFTQDVPDQAHIGKYYAAENYISHSDTDNSLFFKVYKQVRKITLKAKHRLIEKQVPTKGHLLDVGCGTGYFPAELVKQGWMVTGLEPSETARTIGFKQNGFQSEPIEKFYSFPDNAFDAITLWHVLEHVHDLNGYFQQFQRILKPGGYLFIAVPNPDSLDANHFKAEWAAWDVPRHLYHFTPEIIRKLSEKHKLDFQTFHPMWFDAFYVSMLSREIKNQFKWLGLWDGLKSNIHALTNKSHCSSLVYVIKKPIA